MTQVTQPASLLHARALLVVCSILGAANWYLQPERWAVWAAACSVVGAMAIVLGIAVRLSRRGAEPWLSTAASLGSGIVFAGAMLAVSLAVKLAVALGLVPGPDLGRRATMVILGAFLAFTGNALPKTLTPLSALACDGTRVQAFQRFAGWTWVLTGLAFALAWLLLPVVVAKPVSLSVLVGGMLLVAAQLVQLRFTAR